MEEHSSIIPEYEVKASPSTTSTSLVTGTDISSISKLLEVEVNKLTEQVKNTKKDFKELETRTSQTATTLSGLTIGIAIAFGIALIFLILDYLNFRDNFVKKDDFKIYTNKLESREKQLDCLRSKGYFSQKCFEN